MVVSVSFSGASVSYSGIDGAGQREEGTQCSSQTLLTTSPAAITKHALDAQKEDTGKGVGERHVVPQVFNTALIPTCLWAPPRCKRQRGRMAVIWPVALSHQRATPNTQTNEGSVST